MDCIFCKIIRGEAPCYRVYEDENTIVIMDIAKDVDGHMLAIPKKHAKNLLDCDSETPKYLMETVRKIARHCVDDCGCDGVNLLHATGESAGQSVPHFHIHIVPRRTNDGVRGWPAYRGAKRSVEENYEIFRIKGEKE